MTRHKIGQDTVRQQTGRFRSQKEFPDRNAQMQPASRQPEG